jgi:CubicO group peptidase (beta-lactamase class C family)
LIIEKISGKKWQDYIQENIIKPSGMKTTTITDGPHPEKGVSHGYLFDNNKYVEKDYGEEPTFAASGNGGVWSSVKELWNYEQAIQKHIFLDSNWINRSRTVTLFPNWSDSIPAKIGLSWFLGELENEKIIFHTGSQGGFRSDYVWIPGENIFYVLLCNTPKPLDQIRKAVLTVVKEH